MCHTVIKTIGFYEDFVENVEKWFYTSNYYEKRRIRPIPRDKNNKNVIGLMKDGSEGKIIINFETTIQKTYRYRVEKDNQKIKESEL